MASIGIQCCKFCSLIFHVLYTVISDDDNHNVEKENNGILSVMNNDVLRATYE